jgi:taurine transport system permease protein
MSETATTAAMNEPDVGSRPGGATAKTLPAGRRLGLSTRTAMVTSAVLLVLWWAVSHSGSIPALFLPTPEAVAREAWRVWNVGYVDATLIEHTAASLFRVLAALILACAIGVPVGLAIGLSRVARGIFEPIIEFYRPIPPLAYLSLIIIWFGIGEPAKIILITLAILAPITIATASGVRSVDPTWINAARSLGATRRQVIALVVLPATLPSILTGIRIGLGVGWSTLVAAELIAATRGLGFMVQAAAHFLVTEVVILGILVIAVIAFALELAVRLLQRLFVPWVGRS